MQYTYCAVLREEQNGLYSITFPDFEPEASTSGDNLRDALYMAKDALEGYLLYKEDEHQAIKPASDPSEIAVKKGDILTAIDVDTDFVRARENYKLIKKTVNIPNYLNDLGVEKKVNFSQILTKGLKKELGVS